MEEAEHSRESEPVFFAVGKLKLAVLCICTLGLYELYWFYRNWQLVCRRSGLPGWWNPVLRSFFAIFFCYSLFKRVDREARKEKLRGVHPGWTAIAWVALHFSWRLGEPFFWLTALLGFLPLLHVQTTIQELNAELAPRSSPNRRFSAANWAFCALGGLLLVGAAVSNDEARHDGAAVDSPSARTLAP